MMVEFFGIEIEWFVEYIDFISKLNIHCNNIGAKAQRRG
jgi:hypothetical protein